MSKLKLKKAPRVAVKLQNGDVLELRPITALDISELVKRFDLETIELTGRIIRHVQAGLAFSELLINPEIYSDLISTLPDLCVNAICLSAGGDDEDLAAIRELPIEDFAILMGTLINHSLERIGGLGKLLDFMTSATGSLNEALASEIQKVSAMNSAQTSGEPSPS